MVGRLGCRTAAGRGGRIGPADPVVIDIEPDPPVRRAERHDDAAGRGVLSDVHERLLGCPQEDELLLRRRPLGRAADPHPDVDPRLAPEAVGRLLERCRQSEGVE